MHIVVQEDANTKAFCYDTWQEQSMSFISLRYMLINKKAPSA